MELICILRVYAMNVKRTNADSHTHTHVNCHQLLIKYVLWTEYQRQPQNVAPFDLPFASTTGIGAV